MDDDIDDGMRKGPGEFSTAHISDTVKPSKLPDELTSLRWFELTCNIRIKGLADFRRVGSLIKIAPLGRLSVRSEGQLQEWKRKK